MKNTMQQEPLTLSGSDEQVIRAIHAYHFLTVEQICRLLYSPGSLSHARVQLKRLADVGFLQRFRAPTAKAGNTPFIYTLARRGMQYLTTTGITEFSRFRPSENIELSYLFLSHTLAVNNIIIAAKLVERIAPQIQLVHFRHERALRQAPIEVVTATGEKQRVIPDGWLDFRTPTHRTAVILELDRGTEQQRAFRRKLQGLIACAQGPYQAFFETSSMTIAFLTTSGEDRCTLIRKWCEEELKEESQRELAEIFLFLTITREGKDLDPRVFLSPMWQQPFEKARISLLAGDDLLRG
jgi:hypothetical protein